MVSVLTLVVTVAFFMAMDATWFPDRLDPPLHRRSLGQALATFASGTRWYLVVSTVFGLVVAALDTAAMFWLGVPGAALWGLLAFVTNYVPNVGFFIGLVPPTVLALLDGGPGARAGRGERLHRDQLRDPVPLSSRGSSAGPSSACPPP